jgi:hypothetical protein
MAQKVAASGFGIEELSVSLLGKIEVTIDIATAETQIQGALIRVVSC